MKENGHTLRQGTALLLVLCLLLACVPALPGTVRVSAAGTDDIAYPVVGGSIYFNKTTGKITDCDDTVTKAVIPSKIDGTAVTGIGNDAFYNCSSLTSVTIPDSVTTIGNDAFRGCSSLTSVTIPDSVTSIGERAFYYCSSLPSVTIPDSVTSIKVQAFYGCSSLTSVTIGKNVKTIGEFAFCGCSSLTSVTIPDSVTSIWSRAFSGCSNLTSVTIGKGVKTIGDSAFSGSGLKSVTIPDSVTSIGNSAFLNCSSLTSVTIGNGVTSIGNSAFYSCGNLASVTIGKSVTSIGSDAFRYCSSLTSVTIPDSVTSIENQAFYNCSSLTSVTIGNGVISIENQAFYGCRSLTSVTIGKGVTSIGNYAFYGCSSLTSVIIPDSVTNIGSSAFYNCNNLTSVTIGKGVKTIGSSAFYSSGLTSVTIPDSVISIKDSAFKGCGNLTSVTIGNGVTSIGNSAFRGCSSLTSVTIPDSVTSIGNYAFYNCSSLTSVTIGKGVISIGSDAFRYCSSLTKIRFLGDAPKISDAFYGVTATVYYPADNATWTEEMRQNYGGTLSWVPFAVVDISGTVTSASTEAITVELLSGETVVETLTAENGAYRFENFADGTYTLRFTQTGMVKAECDVTVSGASVTKNVTLYKQDDLVTISHSLDLQGEIGVRYYLALKAGVTNPTMTAWRTETERVENVPGTLTGSEYLFVYNVYAMYISDDLTAQFTVEKDGVRYTLDNHVYSVQTYCENQLRKASASAKSKDLFAKLLNYGAYAQRYFNYRTDDLADANLATLGYPVTLDTSAVSAVESTVGTDFAGKVKGHFNGNTLLLEEALGIRYYMVADEAVGDVYMAYRTQGTGDWQYVKAELAPNGSEYFADIANIPSYDIKNVYEAYFCEKTGNTYTQITQTKTYGAEMYAYKKLSSTNTSLRDCVIALMMYADAASAYFGK